MLPPKIISATLYQSVLIKVNELTKNNKEKCIFCVLYIKVVAKINNLTKILAYSLFVDTFLLQINLIHCIINSN